MKVLILTNFSSYLKSYSPILVVSTQIKMLLQNGYQPTLIASEGWNPPEDSIFNQVETVRLPSVPVSNEPGLDATFDQDVESLYEAMKKYIPEEAAVLTHDLIYLPDYVKHQVAARKLAAERENVRWLHLVHSATSPTGLIQERNMFGEKYVELLSEKFPHSIIMFPNAFSIPRVARNFGYEENQVFEVPHAADITEGMSRISQRVFEELSIYEADHFMVYPLRLDRGKNAEMNVRLTAALKRQGKVARLLFCDFQSTGGDKVTYREELKKLAADLDASECVYFLSEIDESASMEVPHETILELLTLSNIFLMPSKSETYSLVTQEAMLRGNFCILNRDFAPFMQIFGDNAIYKQFSSNIGFDGYDGEITTTYGDTDLYFDDLAKSVIFWTGSDKTNKAKVWVRKERNLHYVFKTFLEPLLYAEV